MTLRKTIKMFMYVPPQAKALASFTSAIFANEKHQTGNDGSNRIHVWACAGQHCGFNHKRERYTFVWVHKTTNGI